MPASELDIYLFPAVVGGGLGDIEEVLTAGRRLSRAGFRILLFREGPLPPQVEGPWDWPVHRRLVRLRRSAPRAMTVSPSWGTTAAPPRSEPFGRGGAWSRENQRIETAYGSDRTLHVSLEEFARTLSSREETIERFREGGWSSRAIRSRMLRSRNRREIDEFHSLYKKFRAFDRANVLHLFQTFVPSKGFSREFPEAVQTGPLWPQRFPLSGPCRRGRERRWIWYASPSSSSRLLGGIARGLERLGRPVRVTVRSPHALDAGPAGLVTWVVRPARTARVWAREFQEADLRIVTGSRTLLEALEVGGPFLYFNGVLGSGRHPRAHRPEKLTNLLRVWPQGPGTAQLRRDLRAFQRSQRVAEIVERTFHDSSRRSSLYRQRPLVPFLPPYHDLGDLLISVARRWVDSGEESKALVKAVRLRRIR